MSQRCKKSIVDRAPMPTSEAYSAGKTFGVTVTVHAAFAGQCFVVISTFCLLKLGEGNALAAFFCEFHRKTTTSIP